MSEIVNLEEMKRDMQKAGYSVPENLLDLALKAVWKPSLRVYLGDTFMLYLVYIVDRDILYCNDAMGKLPCIWWFLGDGDELSERAKIQIADMKAKAVYYTEYDCYMKLDDRPELLPFTDQELKKWCEKKGDDWKYCDEITDVCVDSRVMWIGCDKDVVYFDKGDLIIYNYHTCMWERCYQADIFTKEQICND